MTKDLIQEKRMQLRRNASDRKAARRIHITGFVLLALVAATTVAVRTIAPRLPSATEEAAYSKSQRDSLTQLLRSMK